MAGMVSRKRSANSQATPSVATIARNAAVAIALAARRVSERGTGARACGAITGTAAGTGADPGSGGGTGSVAGISGARSVSATGSAAAATATPADRDTGTVAGVS